MKFQFWLWASYGGIQHLEKWTRHWSGAVNSDFIQKSQMGWFLLEALRLPTKTWQDFEKYSYENYIETRIEVSLKCDFDLYFIYFLRNFFTLEIFISPSTKERKKVSRHSRMWLLHALTLYLSLSSDGSFKLNRTRASSTKFNWEISLRIML